MNERTPLLEEEITQPPTLEIIDPECIDWLESNITTLPTELQLRILSNIPERNKSRLALTSKTLYRMFKIAPTESATHDIIQSVIVDLREAREELQKTQQLLDKARRKKSKFILDNYRGSVFVGPTIAGVIVLISSCAMASKIAIGLTIAGPTISTAVVLLYFGIKKIRANKLTRHINNNSPLTNKIYDQQISWRQLSDQLYIDDLKREIDLYCRHIDRVIGAVQYLERSKSNYKIETILNINDEDSDTLIASINRITDAMLEALATLEPDKREEFLQITDEISNIQDLEERLTTECVLNIEVDQRLDLLLIDRDMRAALSAFDSEILEALQNNSAALQLLALTLSYYGKKRSNSIDYKENSSLSDINELRYNRILPQNEMRDVESAGAYYPLSGSGFFSRSTSDNIVPVPLEEKSYPLLLED